MTGQLIAGAARFCGSLLPPDERHYNKRYMETFALSVILEFIIVIGEVQKTTSQEIRCSTPGGNGGVF